MRILHAVADGRPGGGTTNVLALVEALSEKTANSLFFVSQSGSYALDRAREFGAEATGVDFFAGRINPAAVRAFGETLRRVRPDLIHVHGARAGFNLSYVPGELRAVPVAYTVRGYHFLNKPPVIRHLAALGERRCHAMADASVWVCAYDQEIARRWRFVPSGRLQRVIHNGLRLSEVPAPVPRDERLIAFVGRLHYQKNPELAVDMMEYLGPKGFRLKMIGGGELEDAIRRRIRDRGLEETIEVTGALSRKEALAALAPAGYFLLPSRWEGLPLAPIEAMAMDIPVVASRVCGTPEVVEDGTSGILIDRADPRLYAEAILKLDGDPDLRHAMTRAGRARVEQEFSHDVVLERHLALYDRLKAVA